MFVLPSIVFAVFSLCVLSVQARRCDPNFTHLDGFCFCLPPFHLCHDKCGPSKSCPSGIPHWKRGSIDQLQMGKRLCPSGEDVCGSFSGDTSYECIDTKKTLDSCGGCSYPVPGRAPNGKDCSAIEGVANVRCENSTCAVESCKKGWEVSWERQSCDRGPLV